MSTQQHVVIFDAAVVGLPFAMREAYLADLRAWVVACCRGALARDRRPKVQPATALLDASCDGTGSAHDFARWASIGPHAALRRDLNLSPTAVAVLLLAVAPRLWSTIADVYTLLGWERSALDTRLFAALLGGTPADAVAVSRELAPDARLRRAELLYVRQDGALRAHRDVIERIACTR